jgi:lipoprotein-releasing system ATP-binding protein
MKGRVLNVSGVGKSYPSPHGDVAVLSDVSLAFAPGDAAAIMGPSGSGKSTLLYILGALEPPTTGTVTLEGTNPFSLSARELAAFRNTEIGFVFQDHCLLPQCSVLENVLVPTLVGPSDAGSDAHARLLIDQVGLSHRSTHLPGQLSGGEKQRVALARALVRRPRLLLCDEPTGNLDRASADSVASLLFELQQKQQAILIVVTHSADLAARFPVRYDLVDRKLQRAA